MASKAQVAAPGWDKRFIAEMVHADATHGTDTGVFIRDLDSGMTASYKAGESWYLASMVKVPVAIAVLRGVERGQFKLETALTLRAGDYVDGGGFTNGHPVGAQLTVRYLLDQMIIHSDNTASDMLIGLVGAADVNAVVDSLVPGRLGLITGLAEVRQQIFGQLTPAASHISGVQLVEINKLRTDIERLRLIAHLSGTRVGDFRLPKLNDAYDAYYAGGLNSGPLDAYGDLLTQLVAGNALTPKYTAYLLRVMERVVTGPKRIKAGLPPDARFAHKTGTQRARACDAGLVGVAASAAPQRVIVVACVRGERSLAKAERALREVGIALCRSGLLTKGITDASSCHVDTGNTNAASTSSAHGNAGVQSKRPASPRLSPRIAP